MKNSYKIEDSPYQYLYVDITDRCNQKCNMCFFDDKDVVNLDYFSDVCKRLPKRTHIKLLAAEPTISPDFFEFIAVAKQHRHIVSFITNGIRFADMNFCRELRKMGHLGIGLSMNGGLDGNLYKTISGSDIKDIVLVGLHNLIELKFRRICPMVSVIRGVNEQVISDILSLAEKYKSITDVHFRNVFQVGKLLNEAQPYLIADLKKLVFRYVSPAKITSPSGRTCCGGCIMFRPEGKSYTIKLIEGVTDRVKDCWLRGKLLPENKIMPFWQSFGERV